MDQYFNHVVIDEFLPSAVHANLLKYALANEHSFQPTTIFGPNGHLVIDPSFRSSWRCELGLGPLFDPFRSAIEATLPSLLVELQIASFPVCRMESELVAHRHGSFFRPHIDTATQAGRDKVTSDRIVSMVYYFHQQPRKFTGGELAMLPMRGTEPRLIGPADNRLVAFASFAPHEVKPVVCEEDAFEHARFAVNFWLHRAKNFVGEGSDDS